MDTRREAEAVAVAIIQSYPWPDLRQAIIEERAAACRRAGARTAHGVVHVGLHSFWRVNPDRLEARPIDYVDQACSECGGERRVEVITARNTGAGRGNYPTGRMCPDDSRVVECEVCGGSGEEECEIDLIDHWTERVPSVDNPVAWAMQTVMKHYGDLPDQFRADLELKWPHGAAA